MHIPIRFEWTYKPDMQRQLRALALLLDLPVPIIAEQVSQEPIPITTKRQRKPRPKAA